MHQKEIDFSNLEKAIRSLKEAISKHEKYFNDLELHDITRDAMVQRFEFVYEYGSKLLAKCLRSEGYTKRKADTNNKPVLFRTAADAEYLNDLTKWLEYNASRNQTSHEYDESLVTSPAYYQMIKNFQADIQLLCKTMIERVNGAGSPNGSGLGMGSGAGAGEGDGSGYG
jgi:nucleotidyltransferase substrate binding protein (TIGR01987 family)